MNKNPNNYEIKNANVKVFGELVQIIIDHSVEEYLRSVLMVLPEKEKPTVLMFRFERLMGRFAIGRVMINNVDSSIPDFISYINNVDETGNLPLPVSKGNEDPYRNLGRMPIGYGKYGNLDDI